MNKVFLTILFAFCVWFPIHAQVSVKQYDVHELTLTASDLYANPYQEGWVTATFVAPSGNKLTIPGFWDGGDIWKVRISPNEVGNWTYSTTSDDAGLITSGNFVCTNPGTHGGIKPIESFPYHFQYEDGTPFWWLGETCWAGFRSDPSENLSSSTFKAYVDVRASQGFNYLHANVLAGPNEGGKPFTGDPGIRVNPAFWQEVDERVEYMNSRSITVGFMLAWKSDDAVFEVDWTEFPDQESRKRYCKYIAARYGAYNVVWILSGEYNEAPWSEPNSFQDWAELANAIYEGDPYHRMMGIHGTGSVEVFADESWMSFGNYMQYYDNLHNAVLESRDHNKPVVNAEYAYFLRDMDGDGEVDKPNSATLQEFRYASWDLLMAGGYFVTGFGTTYLGGKRDPGPFNVNDPRNDPAEEDLQHIKTFFTSTEWWKLIPADGLVLGTGTKYCLSELGKQYVIYVRGTRNPVTLDFATASVDTYSVRCFDPRESLWTDLPDHVSSSSLTLNPPDNDDWLFFVRKVISVVPPQLFTDVTTASGFIANPFGTHGASVADIDGDDDPDIFINSQEDYLIPPGEYKGNYLFRNNGDGTFTRIDDIAGVQDVASYAHTAIFFDMDNDGDYDLTIGHSRDGLPRRGLFRNEGGGTFTQVDATAGFENTGDIGTRGIVVGDMNGDQFMDIYFSSWGGFDTEYYWGDGSGHFIRHDGLNDSIRAIQGMSMADVDGDGDLDVLMGNFDTNDGIGYYQNNGNGVYNRITGIGLPDTGNGTGTNLGDADGDGDLDVLVNGPRGGFVDLFENLGTSFSKTQSFAPPSGLPEGYSNDNGAFGDFDNDGDLDLYLPTGIPKIWLNTGSGIYTPLDDNLSGVIYEIQDARFPVLLDYDQDGDLDFLLCQHYGPAKLFRNNTDNNHFLRIKLIGPKGDVGGFGTKVRLYEEGHLGDPDHLIMYQEAMASAGYCIQHEPILHFGLGNRPRVDIQIQFINGTIINLKSVAAGQLIDVSPTTTVTYNFPQQGWYLISLPVIPVDNSLSSLFPTALMAFGWDPVTGYYTATHLDTKKGYWLLILSATTASITGTVLNSYADHYLPGWNLIGSVIDSVDFTDPDDNPDGSVIASYGHNSITMQYYPVIKLEPNKGYWIAVAQECDLTVEGGMDPLFNDLTSAVEAETFYKRFGSEPPLPPFLINQDLGPELLKRYTLSQNYPNPFNLVTMIQYSLPKAGMTRLYIYNTLAQRIRTLREEQQQAGTYQVVWDGKNDNGELVTSGIYLYRIITPEFVETRKMLLLK